MIEYLVIRILNRTLHKRCGVRHGVRMDSLPVRYAGPVVVLLEPEPP